MLTKPYFARVFFDPDDDAGAGAGKTDDKSKQSEAKSDGKSDTTVTSPPDEGSPKFTLTQAELDARMAAARKEGKSAAEKAAADAQTAAQAERERKEAEERGEFHKVRESLESERDTAKSEADSLKSRVEQYEQLMQRQLASRKAELKLPEEIMKRFPADADVLTQLEWLEEKAADIAIIRAEQGGPANGIIHPKTPLPNGVTKTEYEKAAEQMRGRIKI
jgi:hypothetical protein